MCFSDPAFQDTSGSAPHFMLATGGNDNLVKLWDVFTASGNNIYHVFLLLCHGCGGEGNEFDPAGALANPLTTCQLTCDRHTPDSLLIQHQCIS